jgi:hypothetical protein
MEAPIPDTEIVLNENNVEFGEPTKGVTALNFATLYESIFDHGKTKTSLLVDRRWHGDCPSSIFRTLRMDRV